MKHLCWGRAKVVSCPILQCWGREDEPKGGMRMGSAPQPAAGRCIHLKRPKPVSLTLPKKLGTKEGNRRRERGLMARAVWVRLTILAELLDARFSLSVVPAPRNTGRS